MKKNEKETVYTADEKNIEISPETLMDSIEEVNVMVEAHVEIITAVRSLIKKYVASGLTPDEAAMVARELQLRAGQKANTMVKFDD